MLRSSILRITGTLGLAALMCMMLLPIPGYGQDTSGKDLINVPGRSVEEGQDIYFGTDMNTSRVTGVEKAVLANRAYTFVATGAYQQQAIVLRYFWDIGLQAPGLPYQHPQETEVEILRSDASQASFWSFKTCVFKNRLYLFFTTEWGNDPQNGLENGKIYMMSAGPVAAPVQEVKPGSTPPKDNNPGPLHFQDKADIKEALKLKGTIATNRFLCRRLCAATVMNGKMYLFFAVNVDWKKPYVYQWLYMETEDGSNWSHPRVIAQDNTFPQSAVTFIACDSGSPTTPAEERIMLAYSRFSDKPGEGVPEIVFFDGKKLYGKKSFEGNTQNITLALGTVKGATNDKHTVQLWSTEGGAGYQKPIYHAEYIPAGPNGDQGSFAQPHVWTKIEQPGYWTARTDPWPGGRDHPYYPFWTPERWLVAWSVGTSFDKFDPTGQKMQQFLDLTFLQRWVYWFLSGSCPRIKTLRYCSDVMKREPGVDPVSLDTGKEGEKWKYLWVLLGVVEGPPPIPANGHPVKELNAQVTRATIGSEQTESVAQTFTAQESFQIGMSFGNPLKGRAFGSFSIGPQFMQQQGKSTDIINKIATNVLIDTTSFNGNDDLGQLVIMKPTITNTRYKVYGYDEKFQVGPSIYALSISDATLFYQSYSLSAPDKDDIWYSKGMKARFATTDYSGWHSFEPPLNDRDYEGVRTKGILQAGKGTSTPSVDLARVEGSVSTNSYGFSVSGDVSIQLSKAVGIDLSGSLGFDWSFTTSSTLNQYTQWAIDLPPIQGAERGIERIRVQPYYLQAKTTGEHAWWIPAHFRERKVQPWCITYKVVEAIPEPWPRRGPQKDTEAGEPASLVVAVPQRGGVVTSAYLGGNPVEDSARFDVSSGEPIDLLAVPSPGYTFEKWIFGSVRAMEHGPSDQVQSWLTVSRGGVATTVSAVFQKIPPKVNISLDEFEPGKDFIDIADGYLDEAFLQFDPARDKISVFVNDYKASCGSREGSWSKEGSTFVFSSKDTESFRLALDLDARTWALYTSKGPIHRGIEGQGADVSMGLSLNGTSYPQSVKARLRSSFEGKELNRSLDSMFKDNFSVLKLKGFHNSEDPARCFYSAEGEIDDLDQLDSGQLSEHGIVAFYVGSETAFQARVSDFVYDEARGILSYELQKDQELTRMKIDLKQGAWSIRITGRKNGTYPQDIGDVYLVIYDDSPGEPGYNVGLGNENYNTLRIGGDLVQMKHRAQLKANVD